VGNDISTYASGNIHALGEERYLGCIGWQEDYAAALALI